MKIIALLVAATLISGCSKSLEEKELVLTEAKKVDAAYQIEKVMTLPDGREVHRTRITAVPHPDCSSCALDNPHWVYFVDQTVTVNHNVRQGKALRNDVQVVLDGKPMTVFEAQTEVEKRIDAVETEERELLRRLQNKYGDDK